MLSMSSLKEESLKPKPQQEKFLSPEEDLEQSIKDSFSIKRIRIQPSTQLINKLFNLYKHITDYETTHSSQKTDYNFYCFKVKRKKKDNRYIQYKCSNRQLLP